MMVRGTSGNVVRARVAPGAGKGGDLARLAGMLCQQALFQRWVSVVAGPAPQGVSAQDHAAEFVRLRCRVDTRAQLDHDARAAWRFHQWVRRPYRMWAERHG
ncbi:hypothetical protein [Bordetella phage vB_BbrS_PHB09]|nr:hypothetical protein [Bordetella phage vB_BbrS_PHB09]